MDTVWESSEVLRQFMDLGPGVQSAFLDSLRNTRFHAEEESIAGELHQLRLSLRDDLATLANEEPSPPPSPPPQPKAKPQEHSIFGKKDDAPYRNVVKQTLAGSFTKPEMQFPKQPVAMSKRDFEAGFAVEDSYTPPSRSQPPPQPAPAPAAAAPKVIDLVRASVVTETASETPEPARPKPAVNTAAAKSPEPEPQSTGGVPAWMLEDD